MVSANLIKRIGWRERILRRDSSILPVDNESLEEMEEVGAYDGIEIGAIQNDGIVCDGEGIVHENIAENFDGDVSEGVKVDGADD